jgi:hypothetical protein
MSFVTPYTAVGTSRIGAGQGFANVINQARNARVQEGYLQNTQKRTDLDEQHYGQQEMDKARRQLDAAMESGNNDMAEAAVRNLKVIAERYGLGVAETRSDIALNTGVTDKVGDQKALTPGSAGKLRPDEVGSEEKPLDVDAYDAAQKVPTDGSSDRVNSEADARIDQALRTPGGSLPAGPPSPPETTDLTPGEEKQFQAWAKASGIRDLNSPDAHYDYRGFWKSTGGAPIRWGKDHFPDTFKQHGHPTFSNESEYAKGDGGSWQGETFVPPIRTPGGSLPTPVTAGAREAPLRGYTLIGRDGKPLYTVAPKDVEANQRKRVGDVFAGLASKSTDPKEKEWLAEAEAAAAAAVGTMPLDEAVQVGLKLFMQRVQGAQALATTEANHKPRPGGGGGGLMGKGADIAESIRYYSIPAANRAQKIINETDQYADMQAGLESGDPALQRNAINVLYKIRAGTAVSAAEDARVGGIVSMLDKLENKFRQWTGGPISPELLAAMKQIVAIKQRINRDRVQAIYDQAADEWEAQNEGKVKDPKVFERRSKTIRQGAKAGAPTSADDKADELLGDQ